MYYIVGLGNPGEEYLLSRHNAGWIVLAPFLKDFCDVKKIDQLDINKKLNALVCEEKIKKEKFQIILPETFMNKSGASLKPLASKIVKSTRLPSPAGSANGGQKKVKIKGKIKAQLRADNLIVIHDDIDLPLGKFKISVGKSSGGHKGVESVIKAVKTKNFIRIRVGVSPATLSRQTGRMGKVKKPKGTPAERGKKFMDFIIGNFKPKELDEIKKVSKKIKMALETIIMEGVGKAQSVSN
jgi:PTH1 family peptidyl-tRNA hydrolase